MTVTGVRVTRRRPTAPRALTSGSALHRQLQLPQQRRSAPHCRWPPPPTPLPQQPQQRPQQPPGLTRCEGVARRRGTGSSQPFVSSRQ